MKENYVYFDILDTARTGTGVTPEKIRRANECIRLGQAELKMSVLRGRIPVFPQTYGWDSAALLSYVGEAGVKGASFKWLIAKGLIRIRLRSAKSIFDAALEAFQNPAYRRLGAWPEFNTNNPIEARRPLVEAMRTGKCPSSLPESARIRLELLRELSDAAAQAPAVDSESPRGNQLSALIAKVCSVAYKVDTGIGNLLYRCTLLPDSNNRTSIFTFLEKEEQRGVPEVHQVRDIINACFNLVAAKCVGAKSFGLTTAPSQDALSVEILRKTLPGSQRVDLFEKENNNLNLSDLSELDVVDWEKVRHFVKDKNELSLYERDREAEAANFIASIAVEKVLRYVIRTEAVHYLALGTISAIGALVAGMEGFIAAVLAGTSGINFRSHEKNQLTKGLMKKWHGLFQVR